MKQSKEKTWEERDREAYDNSEYSRKCSVFYVSWAKWKRLRHRICRSRAEIHLMGPMGQYETLILDSAHHPIGMTRESLDEYIKKVGFIRKPFTMYWIASWNIRAA